jgi:hypothetical protein
VVAVSEKGRIISEFELFRGNGGGIEGWFSDNIPEAVLLCVLVGAGLFAGVI